MAIKEKRGSPINPVLLKFGVALVVSLGGIVLTFFRSRKVKPSQPNPSPGEDLESECRTENLKLQKDNCCSSLEDNLNVSFGNTDDLLLPELNNLVKNYSTGNDISSSDNGLCLLPATETESSFENASPEREEHENMIISLRNKVEFLEERERILEMQLLEYYGLKEQEDVVIELQNQLQMYDIEAKVYQLKIESLQEDNRKLEAKVSNYAEAMIELEAGKAKIKLLRKKLMSDAEHNREQILLLQKRVTKLQEQEEKDQIQNHINLVIEEMEDLKKSNENLKMENTELVQKLEKLQILATSVLDNGEIEELRREIHHLRQQNEVLQKKIEQLQTDRCTDLEEVVYLRWINACLRYELRNYQPGPGLNSARHLSKTMSPESEEKAKKLILEYAMEEGLDFGQWSPSLVSYLESHHKFPDSSSAKSDPSRKNKLFAKLMKLWQRKNSHHNIQNSIGADEELLKTTRTSSKISSRCSFDLDSGGQKGSTEGSSWCSRRTSEDGTLSIFRRINSSGGISEQFTTIVEPQQDDRDTFRGELVKYAEALNVSHGKHPSRGRSPTFSSF